MKLTVAAFAAVILAGLAPSSALAHSTTHQRAHPLTAKVKPVRTPYEASYTDEKFGSVACKGVHVVSARYPGTETSGGADKFRCRSTTGDPVLYGAPGETLVNFSTWASDYFYLKGLWVLDSEIRVVIAKNGKSYRGLAVYPAE